MAQLPSLDTALYPAWQDWAKQLVRFLRQQEAEQDFSLQHQLPTYFATGLPSAAQAGLLIYIADEAKAAVSTSTGGWKRLRFVT